jgi:hypothetical protein
MIISIAMKRYSNGVVRDVADRLRHMSNYIQLIVRSHYVYSNNMNKRRMVFPGIHLVEDELVRS